MFLVCVFLNSTRDVTRSVVFCGSTLMLDGCVLR